MTKKTKINVPQETLLEKQKMSEILGGEDNHCPCRTGGCVGVTDAIVQGYEDQKEKGW